ncbi:Aste57867_8744 [Aphanomyces stellatus]|uniref:Aste57867_8744 protein n=1 Tax=Aphanomyces stellatus TaxID=120398 RepID=A0A485KL40_9STRA|nr:hypothetical protein As57867_008710 [Aphanomyces stellatus]VFT85630.1 Aste57867_8744 [Aphanomyces stellatus]
MTSTELSQAWFEEVQALSKHPHVKKDIDFDRDAFVQEVKAAIENADQPQDAGFVREVKRRRDFAMQMIQKYAHFTDEQKLSMLLGLAVDLGSQDMSLLIRSLPSLLRAHLVLQVLAAALGFNPPIDIETYKHVKRGLVPLPEHFLLLLGSVPSGYSFVLQLRSDLALVVKKYHKSLPQSELHALSYLDKLMQDLFATQTGVHFKRIDLKPENREVLKIIVQNERVHAMRSWEDLAQRLAGPSRHVFGIFHSNMSHMPLVIVETFLTTYMPTVIDRIINPVSEEAAAAAAPPTHGVFYSVSNMHVGLRGLNLASHLLFLTINHVAKLHPTIHTWVTLSPIPTFRAWMQRQLHADTTTAWFTPAVLTAIEEGFGISRFAAPKWFCTQLETPRWFEHTLFVTVARQVLVRLASIYVLFERRESKKIVDPVANFHLQNGAQVESVNFGADFSANGLAQSYGTMINYKYSMNVVDTTSISYKRESTVALSPAVLPVIWFNDNIFLQAIQRVNDKDIHILARQYTKGECITRRGQIPDAVYFLCMGQVVVLTVPSTILEHGSSFGDAEVVLGEPVRFNVVATTLCHVLFVRKTDMQKLLAIVPELKTKYMPSRL